MTTLRNRTETDSYSVEWLRGGDIIVVPKLDQIERVMIVSPCAGDLLHMFYCESCRAHMANVYNLRLHLEAGGDHRIATWCEKRRVYEAISSSAFRQITTEFGEDL